MEELKKTIEEINSRIAEKNTEIQESISSKASTETVEALTTQLEELKDSAMKQGEVLAKLKAEKENVTPRTFSESIKQGFL